MHASGSVPLSKVNTWEEGRASLCHTEQELPPSVFSTVLSSYVALVVSVLSNQF
jgi:hypothetical protein